LKNLLPRLENDNLIITPIDRIDIILGMLAAYRSSNLPKIGGIVLTAYLKPDEILRNLLQGMEGQPFLYFPILIQAIIPTRPFSVRQERWR
jgi:phosphate acetyltransferase